MKAFATLVSAALSCPFAPNGGLGATPGNTTETWSTTPDPNYTYSEMRSSVVK